MRILSLFLQNTFHVTIYGTGNQNYQSNKEVLKKKKGDILSENSDPIKEAV